MTGRARSREEPSRYAKAFAASIGPERSERSMRSCSARRRVVGFAQSRQVRRSGGTTNGVEMLVPIFAEVMGGLGLDKSDIGFWCSGSSDYLAGRAFSFISAIDAIGPVPPINESHVEADAAWALYEAWIKLQTGEVDTALVYGFGKSSAGNLRRTLALQLDPYTLAPLWPDSRRGGRPAGPPRHRRPAPGASGPWPRSPCAAAATPRPTRTRS